MILAATWWLRCPRYAGVEVHPEPEKALSDGPQSLTFPGFEHLMGDVKRLLDFLGQAG